MLKKGTSASPAIARARRVLPGAGRPDQQDALGNAGPQLEEPAGIAKVLDHLLEVLLRLLRAGHVVERDLGPVDGEASRLALRELRGASHSGASGRRSDM